MDYTIGLIDEEEGQLRTIRSTIKTYISHHDKDISVKFKVYSLEGSAEALSESVTQDVINDIIAGEISSLIIDYKIMIQSAMVEGTDIYKKIAEHAPKFPVIILTDFPDHCYEKDFVDADKVYWKYNFFKIEEEYSKEKTKNIIVNMERYNRQRAELFTDLTENLSKLRNDEFSQEVYQKLILVEQRLDDFYPQGQSQIEKALEIEDLKKAVDLLKEVDALVGDSDETESV